MAFFVSRPPRLRVGLEIAPGKARLVMAEKTRDRLSLVAYGARSFGSLEEDASGFAEAVRDLFQSTGAPRQQMGLAFSHVFLFLRRAVLPKLPKKEAARAIRFQAEALFPVELGDLVWDASVAAEISNQTGKKVEVLLVAQHRRMVQRVLSCLEQFGLRFSFLDVEPFALYRSCLEFLPEEARAQNVLLNIGESSVSLHVYKKHLPYRHRVISLEGWSGALEEVRNSLEFWEIESRASLPKVYVTGELSADGAVLATLEDYLQKKIVPADPLQGFRVPPDISGGILDNLRASYGVPLGIVLRRQWV